MEAQINFEEAYLKFLNKANDLNCFAQSQFNCFAQFQFNF